MQFLFSGEIPAENEPFSLLLSRIAAALEPSGWEVSRDGELLEAVCAGLDKRLYADAGHLPLCQHFWDQVRLRPSASRDSLIYTLKYWNPGRVFMHALLSAMVLTHGLSDATAELSTLGGMLLALNLIPVLSALWTLQAFHRCLRSISRVEHLPGRIQASH